MAPLEIVGIVLGAILAMVVGFIGLLPRLIQPIIRLVLAPWYRFRLHGRENVPRSGPVVLAINHVTWIDGLFIAAATPRRGRILANAGFFANPLFNRLARHAGIIPIPFTGPKAQRAAIAAMRAALARGELIAIFPEGQLTRNGLLGPFYRGIEVILKGYDSVPVVPVWLDGLWGSRWSFRRTPRGRSRRTIRVAFETSLAGPPGLFAIRMGIQRAGVTALGLDGRGVDLLAGSVDPALPSLGTSELGPLTGSAPDFDQGGIVQPGRRPGTVGLPLPGVAIRVVGPAGEPLGAGEPGRLEALAAGHGGWADLRRTGRIDPDGFVTVETTEPA